MRELTRLLAIAVTASLWLAFPLPRAVARPNYYDSIELITRDADVVVCGVITEIRPSKTPTPPSRARALPPDSLLRDRSNSFEWNEPQSRDPFQIKIRVTETLKGPTAQEIVLHFREIPSEYKGWMERSRELLFSLHEENQDQASSPTLRLRSGQSVIELDGSGRGVATMDFQWLRSRADILEAARRGAKSPLRHGRPVVRQRLIPPSSTPLMKRPFSGYNATYVYVPVDSRLEELGGKWAKSASQEYHRLAPFALHSFKSDKNIALLKALLSDDLRSVQINDQGQRTNFYMVRSSAYALLKKWGVDVDKPVIEELLLDHPPLASESR